MNIKDFNKNMKNSKYVKIDLISQTNSNWEANVKGEFKNQSDENQNDKGFSNKQLSQLSLLIKEVIHEEVPPIVVNIIHQEVPKIINEQVPPIVETIVDQKLEPLIKEARNHGWNV